MINITYVSLFPEIIRGYFSDSILGKAQEKYYCLHYSNPRDYSSDKWRRCDDYLFGGGAGLGLMCQPLDAALQEIRSQRPSTRFIVVTPSGKPFRHNDAERLSHYESLAFICGRYEGIDERIVEKWADELFCLGDFVLTGGEIAAMAMSDSILRHVEGVLGNQESLQEESFVTELLEAPLFTKPLVFHNKSVPSALLKGNHAIIKGLKQEMSVCKTRYFRPDLYEKFISRK